MEKETYDNFKKKYRNEKFKLTAFDLIIKFIEDFSKYKDMDYIDGIVKQEFYELTLKFLKKENILKNYMLPDNIINNIEIIKKEFTKYKSKEIDEYVEKVILPPLPKYINDLVLNKQLKEKVLSDIPISFNELEKAYLIYYRLCCYLSYNEELIANKNLDGDVDVNVSTKIVHNDIKRLNYISLENNLVSCYEFTAIYAKMLNQLGIDCAIFGDDNDYAKCHTHVKLKVNNCIVKVDGTKGLENSDLICCKERKNTNNFRLYNYEIYMYSMYGHIINGISYKSELIDEFNNSLKKVISHESLKNLPFILDFNISDKQYSFEEKFDILLRLIKNNEFRIVDKIYKINETFDYLFEKEKDIISLSVIVDNKSHNKNVNKGLSIIITIGNKKEEVVYFVCNSDGFIEKKSYYEMLDEFTNSRFDSFIEPIEDISNKVPYINYFLSRKKLILESK